eukprot:scaffold318408_cov22-Tisochrysis_lutea.AAC.1
MEDFQAHRLGHVKIRMGSEASGAPFSKASQAPSGKRKVYHSDAICTPVVRLPRHPLKCDAHVVRLLRQTVVSTTDAFKAPSGRCEVYMQQGFMIICNEACMTLLEEGFVCICSEASKVSPDRRKVNLQKGFMFSFSEISKEPPDRQKDKARMPDHRPASIPIFSRDCS